MVAGTEKFAVPAVADPDVVQVLDELFADYRAAGAGKARTGVAVHLDAGLWTQLDEMGFTRLTGAAADGGSGGTFTDAAAMYGLAAGAAAPVPLVEHDVLAGWLLAEAGLPNDGALRTAALVGADGTAVAVPWASAADAVVALWADADGALRVADVAASRLRIEPGLDIAGYPCDTVVFPVAELSAGTVVPAGVADRFRLRGALARCAQIAGGMERVVEICVQYTSERIQFGRPLARQQAVQQLVSAIAAETALARAATDTAVVRAAAGDFAGAETEFFIAVAKSCVGHAASVVVRNAHQALGAVGTTLEHDLQTLTKPILARRNDFGTVHEWDQRLADLSRAAGPDRLWSLITTGLGTSGADRG